MGISTFLFRRLSFAGRLDELRPRMYRLAFSWSKDAFLADDLVQEAMIRALQKQAQLRDDELLDRWAIRILANLWLDHVRSRPKEENIDDVMDSLCMEDNQSPDCLHCRDEMIECVRRAIMSLPEMQRIVVTLVDLEEFSYKETATILDLPVGTVMSRLSRGRQALRELLIERPQPEVRETASPGRHLRRVI
nr:RNA polymerase sigma factor [Halothiobacillus diazotrophicus]